VMLSRLSQAARGLIDEARTLLGADGSTRPAGSAAGSAERSPRLLGGSVPPAASVGETGSAEPPQDEGSADPEGRLERAQMACVEAVSRMALRSMLPPVVVGLGVPLFVTALLRIGETGDRVTWSAEALVAQLFVATIVGALGSLLFTHAGSAWDNAKRYVESGAHGGPHVVDFRARLVPAADAAHAHEETRVLNPPYVAAVIGDTIGDPLEGAVGPATQALVRTLTVLALVLLPLLL